MNKLLRPAVTLTAVAGVVASVSLAIATTSTPLQDLFGKPAALRISDVCLIVAAVCGAVAGAGRSYVPAVDNPAKP